MTLITAITASELYLPALNTKMPSTPGVATMVTLLSGKKQPWMVTWTKSTRSGIRAEFAQTTINLRALVARNRWTSMHRWRPDIKIIAMSERDVIKIRTIWGR